MKVKSGIAPKCTALQAATFLIGHIIKGKHKGVEPLPQASQACMLPLHQ
ncbi:MAG: hypothetical protein IKV87_03705 [Methanobrevibacter sp.]|nr:hypothetical protein [Methanobrevibacter sp.]